MSKAGFKQKVIDHFFTPDAVWRERAAQKARAEEERRAKLRPREVFLSDLQEFLRNEIVPGIEPVKAHHNRIILRCKQWADEIEDYL